MNDIHTEFRRIGFEPEHLDGLVFSGSKEEVLAWLLTVPSGIGLDAFRRWIPASELTPRPVWDHWPEVGDLFSEDEYRSAFQFINAAPDHLVETYARGVNRRVDTLVLALLSHVSPELADRVARFRHLVHQQRLADGVSPAVLMEGEAAFEAWRASSAAQVEAYREWEALNLGPKIWIRFRPHTDEELIDALLMDIGDVVPESARLWQCEPHIAGTTGAVNFVVGTPSRDVESLVQHLCDEPLVADVDVQWGESSGPPWPLPRFDDGDDPGC